MQSTKGSQRRASMPASVGARKISSTSTSHRTSTTSRPAPSGLAKPTAAKGTSATSATPAAATATTPSQVSPTAQGPTAEAAVGTGSQSAVAATTERETPYKSGFTLTPVSQLPRDGRRASQPRVPVVSERPATWDPEHYNPDGSLRTMHKMPGFDQSYAQAMKARYVRHREVVEREKELSVNEIFGHSDRH